MGATKSYEFSEGKQVGQICKSLVTPGESGYFKHPGNESIVSMWGDSRISSAFTKHRFQHLKELKEAGLISGKIEGVKVCYCINAKEWKAAQAVLDQMFNRFTGNNGC